MPLNVCMPLNVYHVYTCLYATDHTMCTCVCMPLIIQCVHVCGYRSYLSLCIQICLVEKDDMIDLERSAVDTL